MEEQRVHYVIKEVDIVQNVKQEVDLLMEFVHHVQLECLVMEKEVVNHAQQEVEEQHVLNVIQKREFVVNVVQEVD